MAKLQLDPKKVEVVKKTVTVAGPKDGVKLSESAKDTAKKFVSGGTTPKAVAAAGDIPVFQKTKGGVPTNPTDAANFFKKEIARHSDLTKKYLRLRNSVLSNSPEYKMYDKKLKQVFDNLNFLNEQDLATQRKTFNKEMEQEDKEYRDSVKNAPIMEKVKQKLTNKGSAYMIG